MQIYSAIILFNEEGSGLPKFVGYPLVLTLKFCKSLVIKLDYQKENLSKEYMPLEDF